MINSAKHATAFITAQPCWLCNHHRSWMVPAKWLPAKSESTPNEPIFTLAGWPPNTLSGQDIGLTRASFAHKKTGNTY